MINQPSHKLLLALIASLVVIAIVIFCYRQFNFIPNSGNTSDNSNTPKISGTPLGILITDPDLKATVTSPLLIKGSASMENFPDDHINFQIIDSTDKVLGQGSATRGASSDNNYYDFETQVNFTTGQSGLGFIMINNNPNFKFPIQL
jgi:hypothetical protein